MRVLYLDLGMGAAGDMLSAALFELLSRKEQEDYLSAMNHLGLDGVSVQAERSEKCGITGTHMTVLVDGSEEADVPDHAHTHVHAHHHHALAEIHKVIGSLNLPDAVKCAAGLPPAGRG